ncbi:MAG: GNAT family N-acetyltransferase [Tissierellales bacterium]|nr:GNAT family N-acetyltransferase [Tissierellales bacterium]
MLIQVIDESVRDEMKEFLKVKWGSMIVVSKGKAHNLEELPGFVVIENERITGVVTYDVVDKDCEIISLDSVIENRGLGSKLLDKVIEIAKIVGCERVWLMTTNDNTKAMRFYQKRGFDLVGFYKDAMVKAREIKPEIPKIGYDDIPIKHELEFEKII